MPGAKQIRNGDAVENRIRSSPPSTLRADRHDSSELEESDLLDKIRSLQRQVKEVVQLREENATLKLQVATLQQDNQPTGSNPNVKHGPVRRDSSSGTSSRDSVPPFSDTDFGRLELQVKRLREERNDYREAWQALTAKFRARKEIWRQWKEFLAANHPNIRLNQPACQISPVAELGHSSDGSLVSEHASHQHAVQDEKPAVGQPHTMLEPVDSVDQPPSTQDTEGDTQVPDRSSGSEPPPDLAPSSQPSLEIIFARPVKRRRTSVSHGGSNKRHATNEDHGSVRIKEERLDSSQSTGDLLSILTQAQILDLDESALKSATPRKSRIADILSPPETDKLARERRVLHQVLASANIKPEEPTPLRSDLKSGAGTEIAKISPMAETKAPFHGLKLEWPLQAISANPERPALPLSHIVGGSVASSSPRGRVAEQLVYGKKENMPEIKYEPNANAVESDGRWHNLPRDLHSTPTIAHAPRLAATEPRHNHGPRSNTRPYAAESPLDRRRPQKGKISTPNGSFEGRDGSTRSAPPPNVTPLRSRPLSELRLDDFRVNSNRNQGYDYAFSEVVRGKEARRCLPGCTKAECCGSSWLAFAKVGTTATTSTTRSHQDLSHGNAVKTERKSNSFGGMEEKSSHHVRKHAEHSPSASARDTHTDTKSVSRNRAEAQRLADRFGKHRQAFQRSSTPPGFWRTDMPSTQELAEDRSKASQMEKGRVEERYHEAIRKNGRWKFRDEV